MTDGQPGTMGRREALALLGGLAAFLPDIARAQPALDRAAFLDASGLVTGMPAESLTGLTDALFEAFRAQGPVVLQLAALARQTPPADLGAAIRGTPMEPVARALAASWYTGTLGPKLLSYEDALSWKVAGLESVPGQCAGEFGFWSDAPAVP